MPNFLGTFFFMKRILYCIAWSALVLWSSCRATGAEFNDRQIVAITILAEARGEGKAGMYAVACVIQQRSIERKFSAARVCLQQKQFSCWNSGDPQRHKLSRLLSLPQAEYALFLADNLDRLQRGFIGNANHYHTKRVNPYWSKGKRPVATIGNHHFFRL